MDWTLLTVMLTVITTLIVIAIGQMSKRETRGRPPRPDRLNSFRAGRDRPGGKTSKMAAKMAAQVKAGPGE